MEHPPEKGSLEGKSTKKRRENHRKEGEEEVDSDVDNLDFNNFKGIYFGDKTEKF